MTEPRKESLGFARSLGLHGLGEAEARMISRGLHLQWDEFRLASVRQAWVKHVAEWRNHPHAEEILREWEAACDGITDAYGGEPDLDDSLDDPREIFVDQAIAWRDHPNRLEMHDQREAALDEIVAKYS